MFHPDGVVYSAEVRPLAEDGPLGELAQRLSGRAIARFSGALWRQREGAERPDVLGLALRFLGSGDPKGEPREHDQDLLLATFRSALLLPIAPLITNAHDYLRNSYHAVLPSRAPGLGRVKWRVLTVGMKAPGKDRRERLQHAVASGAGVLCLEVRQLRRGAPWVAVAAIELVERLNIDQRRLEFNPFRAGLGIVPIGLLQAMRAPIYAASQRGRRAAEGCVSRPR